VKPRTARQGRFADSNRNTVAIRKSTNSMKTKEKPFSNRNKKRDGGAGNFRAAHPHQPVVGSRRLATTTNDCGMPPESLPWTPVKDFNPFWPLRNAHAMTVASVFWPRKYPRLPAGVSRLFEVEPGTQIRGECHWQEDPRAHSTIVLLHGLEGSSESGYMLGTAEKAFVAGFNVVRLNQRNCGGTDNLTPTLYHSGLSGDIRAVILEIIERDRLREIFAAGFSMGGNLVLKMAGEFGDAVPAELRGFVAIAPAMDLAACAGALEQPRNFLYERRFVKGLKRRMHQKASLFPERYPLNGLDRVSSVREFDDAFTARFSGFRDANDYYARSSANQLLGKIQRPTLIITAQDDPVVPFASFDTPELRENPNITFVATKHGGHCGFISRESGDERFWSEGRIVEFCKSKSVMQC
jgi:predicted alpha/beta-fold hydrolase